MCVSGRCAPTNAAGKYTRTLPAGVYEVRTAIADFATTCSPGKTANFHNFPGDTCTIDLRHGDGVADFSSKAPSGCSARASVFAFPSAAETCCTKPVIEATARVVRGGDHLEVKLIARRLGPEHQCGAARITIGSHTQVTRVKRTASAETATVHLGGARSCINTLRATVHEGGASDVTTAPVTGGPDFQTARAVRKPSGEVQLLARVDRLRPEAVCGRAHLSADGVKLGKIRQTGLIATGRGSLKGRHECVQLIKFTEKQDLQTAHATRKVSGAVPTLCHKPGT